MNTPDTRSPASLLLDLAHALGQGDVQVVDLTHALSPDIPTFEGEPCVITPTMSVSRDGWMVNHLSLSEHTGTHVDAPAHRLENGATVDTLQPERLIGQAAVVDVRKAVEADGEYAANVGDLRRWERRHGAIGEGHIVLIRTGWSAKWADRAAYMGTDEDDVLHFPGISEAAGAWLASHKVKAVGIDTLSIDPGASAELPAHGAVLGSGAFHIENLANLDKLPESGAIVVVAPLRVAAGSGAPARVLALVPIGAAPQATPPTEQPTPTESSLATRPRSGTASRLIAYTDGGCRGNPGIGGWGFLLIDPDSGAALSSRGGEGHTTNNRMEMTAAIEVLEALKQPGSAVEIRTDSRYLVDMATKWMAGWKRKGWKKKGGEIKNLDLVKRVDTLQTLHKVRWTWVRGHVGEPGNEYADMLTNQAMDAISSGASPRQDKRMAKSPVRVS